MRILVFLLVVVNLVFLSWTRGFFGTPDNPDAVRLTQQVQPEKLQVVLRDDPPLGTSTNASAEKCVAWAPLSDDTASTLELMLATNYALLRRVRLDISGAASWWVFIPPFVSKAEVDRKIARLQTAGISDFYVVQDSGVNRFAISLGIFSSEEGARERFEILKNKGVIGLKMGRRGEARPGLIQLEASGSDTLVDAAVDAVRRSNPDLKTSACSKY